MPTYSYRCPQCGHAFDIQQSFTDAALTACDRCGGALRKVFSPVGIAFKGSGFYRTDSGASGKGSSESPAGTSTNDSNAHPAKGNATSGDSATSTANGTAQPATSGTAG